MHIKKNDTTTFPIALIIILFLLFAPVSITLCAQAAEAGTAVNEIGVISARNYDGVWAAPYSGSATSYIAQGSKFDNQQVQVVREAQTRYGTYEQFMINGRVIGWLDRQAFKVIGRLSLDKVVNDAGTVRAAVYDGIWANPYLGPGTPYVGQGNSYNGRQVQIVREAQTNYGTYEQFTVNGRVIGWLDKKAFSSTGSVYYNNTVNQTGLIRAQSYDSVWVNPYTGKANTWVAAGSHYDGQLVQIVREAKTAYGTYKQFTVNGRTIGWLDSKAFSAIGQLNSNNVVNNVGTINAAKYDGVWSIPYLGSGTPNVGQGINYNGKQVQIIREARTNYGTYEQFSMNGKVIGWLDKKAFSSISKTYYNNAVTKGGVIRSRSYDSIWANPYTGSGDTRIVAGSTYNGKFVTIVREAKTVCGTYEQFAINGQVIGWLDVQAFSPINTMNGIQSVNSSGKISAASSDGIWATPYLGSGSPYVDKGTNYNGQQVQNVQEARTGYGTYEQFTVNGKIIGWLDKKAFLSASVLKKGVDISRYQNTKPINFSLVSQSGISFVIAKATEGTYYTNKYFLDNITSAKSAGLQTSAYHYFTATNTTEAKSEADYFAAELNNAQMGGYAFIDVEDTNNCSRSQLTDNVNTFLSELQNKGFTKLGIYSNINFLNNNLYLSSIRMSNPGLLVWTAWYSGNPNSDLWQYSDSGTINGITGSVDLDYSYAYRF